MSRNPLNCPHNITELDKDTGEEYCVECGDVILDEQELNDELWKDIL